MPWGRGGTIGLTDKAQREMEERFKLQRRAVELLDLVAVEFSTDPTSVQCFDLRIVAEVIEVSRRLKKLIPEWER
jgi:hypothetical protein